MNLPTLSAEAASYVASITGSPSPDIDQLDVAQLTDLLLVLEVELDCERTKGELPPDELALLASAIEDVKRQLLGRD